MFFVLNSLLLSCFSFAFVLLLLLLAHTKMGGEINIVFLGVWGVGCFECVIYTKLIACDFEIDTDRATWTILEFKGEWYLAAWFGDEANGEYVGQLQGTLLVNDLRGEPQPEYVPTSDECNYFTTTDQGNEEFDCQWYRSGDGWVYGPIPNDVNGVTFTFWNVGYYSLYRRGYVRTGPGGEDVTEVHRARFYSTSLSFQLICEADGCDPECVAPEICVNDVCELPPEVIIDPGFNKSIEEEYQDKGDDEANTNIFVDLDDPNFVALVGGALGISCLLLTVSAFVYVKAVQAKSSEWEPTPVVRQPYAMSQAGTVNRDKEGSGEALRRPSGSKRSGHSGRSGKRRSSAASGGDAKHRKSSAGRRPSGSGRKKSHSKSKAKNKSRKMEATSVVLDRAAHEFNSVAPPSEAPPPMPSEKRPATEILEATGPARFAK